MPSSGTPFTSDRLRLLAPLITERVLELAHWRISTGEKFFKGRELVVPDGERVVKIALLVAHEINPYEDFSAEEEALMRGISANTLRDRKQSNVLRPL